MPTPTPLVAGQTRRRPNRVVAFGLAAEDWDRLEMLASAELRDPVLQARWIVLQALKTCTDEVAS